MLGKFAVLVAAVAASVSAQAFEEVPRESAKALKVTRGKPFTRGLVFVNGKYIDPPYVVERWGTGIRINSVPVTGQVIDWSEFIKTQDASKVLKTVQELAEPAQPAYMPQPQPEPAQSDADALDDLFDDNPAPKKPAPAPSRSYRAAPPRPRLPTTKYELVGDFVKNDASKAMVRRINEQRTEIDTILRRGGFIFFGDTYSRVVGDARTLETMLDSLPEIMQHSEDVHSFRAKIRQNGMVYLNETLSGQLFNNRIDYRRLQERRQKIKSDNEWTRMLEEVDKPLL